MSVLKSKIKHPCIMVCVTQQEACSRLIEAGARIAKEENLPLSVISVFRESRGMNANDGGALENLFVCARKHQSAAAFDGRFGAENGTIT